MLRAIHKRVVAIVAGMAVVLLSFVGLPAAHAANVEIAVDGGQKLQTISALGADINPHSWDNGKLKPVLDLLIDQGGMKTFRVGMDMIDWESTNDDADPNTFNWDYYNPIYSGQTSFDTKYAGSNFSDTWNVIDYLHQRGIPNSGIELSFMGPGPSWMGGNALASGQEDEFVEEVISAAYYGYSHGHTFGLFSPNNEMDISANEGITMSDTRYADILNRLAGRMDALGMGEVRLLGPETCCNTGYATPMKALPTLMAKLGYFVFHNYNGNDNGAAAAVAGTGKDFWISEYANWESTFTYLDQGASGLQMWEAYDSVYNHAVLNGKGSDPGNDSLPFGNTPLIAYNETTGVYTPRNEFYYFGQLFRWIPIGAQRIHALSGNSNVRIEAFQDAATTRLSLVGQNTSGSAQTLTIALSNLATPPVFQYYQTNSSSHMAQGADVPVSGGSATVTVPANTTFTLTGLGVPDEAAPTAPRDLSATGAMGTANLAWGASTDNVGVTRYNVYRSMTSGFTPGDTTRVGQSSTTSFTDAGLSAGTYYYVVTAQDAVGNTSPPSNEASATVTADTTAPAVSVTAPGNGATVSGTVNVTASASDNVGVAGVQLKLDGVNLGSEVTTTPYTTTWDTTKASNGSHLLYAVARDAAGNTTTSSAVAVTVSNAVTGTQLLGINTIQGSTDHDAAGEAEAFRSTATASGQAGSLTLYVDSGSGATTLKAGVYSDASGRPGTLLASGSLSAPRTAAWNTVVLSSNPTLSSGTTYWIALLGTGGQINYRDTSTGSCSQSNATTGLSNLPATWSPGTTWPTCNLSAYVSATAPDTTDTTPPTVSITSPAAGATVSGTVSVTASATDNVGVAGVQLRLDGANLGAEDTTAPYSVAWDTTTAATGSHTLTAVARDAAGNLGTAPPVSVTVLNGTPTDTTPPTVSITSPAAGATVSGTVSVTASATDNVGVAGVQLRLDGANLGAEDTTAPYSVAWDTTTAATGSHTLTAVARDAAGNTTTSSPVTVTVTGSQPVTLDKQVTTHQSTTSTRITSPALTTAGPNELLVAFISSDGPSQTGGETFSSVTGGGLSWTLRKRVNASYGTAEIWTAPAAAVAKRVTVRATRSSGSYTGSITVAAFRNASLTTAGATGGASATSGAPTASLTATRTGSLVWGVGNDWDRAAARTVGADQTLVDQFLATGPACTFWVQRLNSPGVAGQAMTISDTAPTTDRWNLATIEIIPAG